MIEKVLHLQKIYTPNRNLFIGKSCTEYIVSYFNKKNPMQWWCFLGRFALNFVQHCRNIIASGTLTIQKTDSLTLNRTNFNWIITSGYLSNGEKLPELQKVRLLHSFFKFT